MTIKKILKNIFLLSIFLFPVSAFATNGVCGTAFNDTFTGARGRQDNLNGELCEIGLPNDFELINNDLFIWDCLGNQGGYSQSCSANYSQSIDAVCGSAFGETFTGARGRQDNLNGELCETGLPTDFEFSAGQWIWECNGLYGGASLSCDADFDNGSSVVLNTGGVYSGTLYFGPTPVYHWDFDGTFVDRVQGATLYGTYPAESYLTGTSLNDNGSVFFDGHDRALRFTTALTALTGSPQITIVSLFSVISEGGKTFYPYAMGGGGTTHEHHIAYRGSGHATNPFQYQINRETFDYTSYYTPSYSYTKGGRTYYIVATIHKNDASPYMQVLNSTGGRDATTKNNPLYVAPYYLSMGGLTPYHSGGAGYHPQDAIVDELLIFTGGIDLQGSGVLEAIMSGYMSEYEPEGLDIGVCGTAFGQSFTGDRGRQDNLSGELCESGTPTSFTGNSSIPLWTWECEGLGDGPDVSCSADYDLCGTLDNVQQDQRGDWPTGLFFDDATYNDTTGLCGLGGIPTAVEYTFDDGWYWVCTLGLEASECFAPVINSDYAQCASIAGQKISLNTWTSYLETPSALCSPGTATGYAISTGYYSYVDGSGAVYTGYDETFSGSYYWTCLGNETDAYCSAYPGGQDFPTTQTPYNWVTDILGAISNPILSAINEGSWFGSFLGNVRPYLDFSYTPTDQIILYLPSISSDMDMSTTAVNVSINEKIETLYTKTCSAGTCTIEYSGLNVTQSYKDTNRRKFFNSAVPVLFGLLYVMFQIFVLGILFLFPARLYYKFLEQFAFYFLLRYFDGDGQPESLFHFALKTLWIVPLVASTIGLILLFSSWFSPVYLTLKGILGNFMQFVLVNLLHFDGVSMRTVVDIITAGFYAILVAFLGYILVRRFGRLT